MTSPGRPVAASTASPRGTGGRAAPWRTALSLFTVLPVAGPSGQRLERADVTRAVLWLPVAGAVLGSAAAAVLVVVAAVSPGVPGRLLASVLAVSTLALLTGLLHLDGLADTADGLGSRLPPAEALAVMRRSDIGPFGVAALVIVLLVQVSALAAVPSVSLAAAGLVLAAVVGRTAVVLAAARGVPGARSDGFGALVTDSVSRTACAVTVAVLAVVVATGCAALWGPGVAVRFLTALSVGLLAGYGLRRWAHRRLEGMTGDVFGALIEVSTAAVLLTAALTVPAG